MNNITTRLNTLIEIYNIPLKENWEGYATPDNYSPYKYWSNMGLISREEFESIHKHRNIISGKNFINFFKNFDTHYKPNYYKNGLVADVGSGFGFITFWLLLSGAKQVYTIGDPTRIAFIEQLYNRAVELKLIDSGGISFSPAFVKVGDVSLSDKIKDNTLSLVVLHDTLEHITPRIFPWLVKSTFNNLQKGGRFISVALNTDSPEMRNELLVYWDKVEKETTINNRLKLIKENLSTISEDDAQKLARHTRGFDSIDFFEALKKYQEVKVIPELNTSLPPIDIESDVPYEGDTGIERICKEFAKNNFTSVRAYPNLLSASRARYFQPIAKLLPGLFIKLHIRDRNVTIVAVK